MQQKLKGVLVSDFDGTMTHHDFFKLAVSTLLPAGTPNYWERYRSGEITHFEALRRYFASIRASEAEVLDVVERMELDAHLGEALESLRAAGWRVVVASAGCEWYIRKLLDKAGAQDLEVHSNPGHFQEGQGLLMLMPAASLFHSEELGVSKLDVVRHYIDQGVTVAFAGDGFPDVEPGKQVPAELRFARGDMAEVLTREGLPFRSYDSWSSIAKALLQHGGVPS